MHGTYFFISIQKTSLEESLGKTTDKHEKSEDIKKYIEHQQRKSSLYTCHAIFHMDVAKRIFSSSKKG